MRPHGYARYRLDGCRCYVCAFARSEYDRRRDRLMAYGQWEPFVPIEEAQTHLHALYAIGYGTRRVAELAGLNRKIVRDVGRGWRSDPGRGNPSLTKIRRETATAILALPLDPMAAADGALIDATETWERVHAMVANGYPKVWVAHQLGKTGSSGVQLLKTRVTVANANAVLELYDRVGDTPGPSDRARREGIKHGWLTPFQLEASKFGDAEEDPADLDEIAVERIMGGTLVLPLRSKAPELPEAIRRLAFRGLNDVEIASRVGRQHAAVTAVRLRAGITAGLKSCG